jgi:hypothetical protein
MLLALVAPLPAQAGPPFLTGDPDTVDAGHWEISAGARSERRPGSRLDALPAIEVNYGVAEGWEASIEAAWLRLQADGVPTERGSDNPILGLKWRILQQEKDGVTFAVKPEYAFGNSSSARKGLADERGTFLVDLRLQREYGPFQLGVAVAPTFTSGGTRGWDYGGFVKREIEHKHTIGLELNGSSVSGGGSELLVNLGAQVQLVEGGKLLLGIGRELRNSDEPKMTSRAYVGWQFAF